ncbi:MAG: hypothetical protein MUF49_26670 [Oculatellaceae cyanobacterium Prado106]|jgi:hypothetical protein|nr:hypothetical protein [Oculatellaceae cyanobacterium Prado106]
MSSLFSLLEKIKAKPGLYIGKASITDLRMFILGYRFARSELNQPHTEAETDFYKNFQPWLQTRLNLRTSKGWDKIILFTVANETQAFDYFFQLLAEFQQRNPNEDVDPLKLDLDRLVGDRKTA